MMHLFHVYVLWLVAFSFSTIVLISCVKKKKDEEDAPPISCAKTEVTAIPAKEENNFKGNTKARIERDRIIRGMKREETEEAKLSKKLAWQEAKNSDCTRCGTPTRIVVKGSSGMYYSEDAPTHWCP